uniref:protein-tyrosine-phosphatase n=2 Tax=Cacopsylla melanoneura TaxID=428564 RepID=A0A8D8LWI5_9HEMI
MKMPSGEEEFASLDLCVSKSWLLQELRSDPSRLIILDCRSSNEYTESHIRHAVNFSIPSIMLRRLAAGKIELLSTIKCRDLKEKIMNAYKDSLFVVYGDSCISENEVRDREKHCYTASDTMNVLTKRLQQDGCQVVCLLEGFLEFRAAYPEWCEGMATLLDPMPLMGLQSLRISAPPPRTRHRPPAPAPGMSSDSSDSSNFGLDDEEDRDFPVEILPNLYLGNASNSEDVEALTKHNIKYVLNVTADLPNVFEATGSIKYMQIPIADHWSQNLATYFPQAIQFIEEARNQDTGVLVHCLAGVSRSVTITVAYLMSALRLSLNDAFTLVRARKSNIAPNFHFMEQLNSFEKELTEARLIQQETEEKCGSCGRAKAHASDPCPGACTTVTSASSTSYLSPLSIIGQSPDSGIEFDRWTPGTGG